MKDKKTKFQQPLKYWVDLEEKLAKNQLEFESNPTVDNYNLRRYMNEPITGDICRINFGA